MNRLLKKNNDQILKKKKDHVNNISLNCVNYRCQKYLNDVNAQQI